MDIEELNQALLYKMAEEQGQYRDWLLGQSPEEILSHAYEFAMREDILMEMEELSLPVPLAEALLESPAPMSDIYKDFRDLETGHMDHVRECIVGRAERLLESKREFTRTIPVYMESSEYAIENDQFEVWQISHQTNIACKDAIETAISEGYDGMRLTADAKDILAEFGPERVSFVLAHTLQVKSYDARFSRNNVAWAKSVPVVEEGVHRCQYTVSSHPGLLNLFVDTARSEMEQTAETQNQRKSSIKAQLVLKPIPSDRPDKPRDMGAR